MCLKAQLKKIFLCPFPEDIKKYIIGMKTKLQKYFIYLFYLFSSYIHENQSFNI